MCRFIKILFLLDHSELQNIIYTSSAKYIISLLLHSLLLNKLSVLNHIHVSSGDDNTDTFSFQIQSTVLNSSKTHTTSWFYDDFHYLSIKPHSFNKLLIRNGKNIFDIFIHNLKSKRWQLWCNCTISDSLWRCDFDDLTRLERLLCIVCSFRFNSVNLTVRR